jgi:acetylornithine deacetylase/succinyl-diaminopimelate desuccinylase-like protein
MDNDPDDVRSIAAEAARRSIEVMRDFLIGLIRIPTHDIAGCRIALERVASEFSSLGIDFEWSTPVDTDGFAVPTVIGWIGSPTKAPDLLLNAHVDTAPQGEGWMVPAYEGLTREGRIYGRGAFTKVDVAVFTHAAAAAAHACSQSSTGSVAVAITADEGSGGYIGVKRLLDELQLRPRRVISNGITHSVTIAHSGCVQAKVRILGRGCHQAIVEPKSDVMRHAVLLARRVQANDTRLRRVHSDLSGIASPTISVTRIDGGTGFGMAPVNVEMWIDRRTVPSEPISGAERKIRDLVRNVAISTGADMAVEIVRRAEPLRPSPEQLIWAKEVQVQAETVLGHEPPLRGLPIYTDARWFGARGIPTVMYGAGADLLEAGSNGPDENVSMSDMTAAATVIARVVAGVLVRANAVAH